LPFAFSATARQLLEVLLVLGFVNALLVDHHALGRGAGGGEQGARAL